MNTVGKDATIDSLFEPNLSVRLLNKKQSNIINIKNEEALILSAQYIPSLKWYAITVMPTEELYLPIKNAILQQVMISVLIACLLIAIGYWLALAVSRPISKASDMLNNIASGEADLTLTMTVESNDEVGQLSSAFNRFTNQLQSIFSGVVSNATQIMSISSQLSGSSQMTLKNTVQQHQSIDMIASAITEMAASIKDIATNSQSTADAAQDSIRQSQQGQEIVNTTIDKINTVYDKMNGASLVIETLAQDVNEISDVFNIISGISKQTNLLALNAAIEAARAGEQGRGFAVVADEVRGLALRTNESTEQINHMIVKLQRGAEEAVNAMSSGIASAKYSVSTADSAGVSLSEILKNTSIISDLSSQVAIATEEQATVIEELNSHIVSVKHSSDQINSESEAINGTCQSIETSAIQLSDLVRNFKI